MTTRPQAPQGCVKKPCNGRLQNLEEKTKDRHLLLDVLREVGAEIGGFHAMLEASLISAQLTDLRITEGHQFLLYMRNLSDKVAEFAQVGIMEVCGKAVSAYDVRDAHDI